MALERALLVPGLVHQLGQLGHDRGPLLPRIGSPDDHVPAIERIGERRRIALAPRHLDRLVAKRCGPVAEGRIAKRSGEPREQPHPHAAVARLDGGERLLEQRHEATVASGARPDEPPAVAEGRAREPLAQLFAPSDLGRAPEALLRPVAVARAHLRVAHREEQVAADLLVHRVQPVEQLQAHPVQAHRLLVGQRGPRPIAGHDRVAQGLVRVAALRALEEVVRELGRVRLGIRRVDPFEHLPDPAVRPGAPAGRKLLVERIANEAVREPKPPADLGDLDDHVGGQSRVQDVERLVAGDPPEGEQGELAADDRCAHEQVGTGLGQVGQALRDHLPDGRRDRGAPGVLEADQPPLGREQPDHLLDEQRVALGAVVDRRGQGLGRIDLGREREEAGDVVLGQPAQRQPPRGVVPGELGQRRPQRVIAAQVDLAVGTHDQDPRVRDRAGEELEEQQRRRVGRLEVVEHQHERRGAGRVAQKRRRRVEEPKPRALGFQRGRRRQVGHDLAQLGEHLCDDRGARAQLRAHRLRADVPQVGAQRLHPRPVGGCTAGLPAPSRQHPRALLPGPGRELARQPALADPGLASDEDHRAPRPARGVEAGEQLRPAPGRGPRRRRLRAPGARAAPRRSSSASSWRRIACSRSRSSRPGSIPSSSTRVSRAWR